MRYHDFGKTGFQISAIGFGSMRLPIPDPAGAPGEVDLEPAVDLLCHAFAKGVNYVDTAYMYCHHLSEVAVGRALKRDNWREKVRLATKLPLWNVKQADDFWRILEEQLQKLDTGCIDFYHLHGIGGGDLDGAIREFKIFESAAKARDRGLIRNLSFSFHDKPEEMKKLVDTGEFVSVLCQYNLLDTANAGAISYAASKGLGTIAMGPVGGGRLAFAEGVFEDALGGSMTTPELALRFVLSHPDLDCALSGMGSEAMVNDNIRVAESSAPLSVAEIGALEQIRDKCRKLSELYCTGCGYCRPDCPCEVNIPVALESLIYYKVYQFKQHAFARYKEIGTSSWVSGKNAGHCIDCGKCESKCPQKLPIRRYLREARELFEA
jgi:hypothetical protein